MARMRESNDSLSSFQKAARTKIIDDGINRPGDDPDSESEVSEEDPDDDDAGSVIHQPQHASETLEIKAPGPATSAKRFNSETIQPLKPRHLQDKQMVYIFSVQRSEIRKQEKSQPIVIKQFLDRDDANAFAEDELKRARWGPSLPRPQITQSYSKESGLFSGIATIDSEDNVFECVDVVALAQYTGNLDNFDDTKVKVMFKPKLYLILRSITTRVQIPPASHDAETSENEEIDQKDDERSANGEENSRETGEESIDALFEEERVVDVSDNFDYSLTGDARRSSLSPTAPHRTTPDMMLKQTCKTLEVYTDRELANKRASEIFLEEIKPVGGDIDQLAEYENDAVRPIKEHLESHNNLGELFSASNENTNEGYELTVWVEDFELGGPLN
jgi:hypothetical protein